MQDLRNPCRGTQWSRQKKARRVKKIKKIDSQSLAEATNVGRKNGSLPKARHSDCWVKRPSKRSGDWEFSTSSRKQQGGAINQKKRVAEISMAGETSLKASNLTRREKDDWKKKLAIT